MAEQKITAHLLNQPLDLLPGVCLAVPHAVVDPLARVFLEVFAILAHEYGVGRAYFVTDGARVVETAKNSSVRYKLKSMEGCLHVVRDVDVRRAPAELPGVSGEHQNIKASLPSTIE